MFGFFFPAWTVLDGTKPSETWGSNHILSSDNYKKQLRLINWMGDVVQTPFPKQVSAPTQGKGTCGQKDFFAYCFAEGCTSEKDFNLSVSGNSGIQGC